MTDLFFLFNVGSVLPSTVRETLFNSMALYFLYQKQEMYIFILIKTSIQSKLDFGVV